MKTIKTLAIDLGASSGRGIVGTFDGKKVELKENHRFSNDPVMVNGRFSWDILRIFHEIKNSIRNTVLSGEDIRTVGIDTWGVDYGYLDKNGMLMRNPIHYRDVRTDSILPFVEKSVPLSEIYDKSGIQSINFNTVYQLSCDVRDDKGLLDLADKMLFIPDMLDYFLTGKAKTEYTIASTGAILDAKTKKYAFDILEKLGIDRRLFCEIVEPGYNMGKLLPSVLEEVGDFKGDVVKVASHDTASAVLAVPAKNDDFVYISSGTWSLMGIELSKPLINDKTRELNYTNEGGIGNTIRFLKNIMGLWIFQECRRQWIREGREYSFSELTKMAENSKPLQSLINPDDKLFATQGNMPERIRNYCKKTGQHIPENEGEIVRTILESLALRYAYTVKDLELLSGKKIKSINVVGGGTQNKLLCQLTADACGVNVIAGPVEATAIGNIFSQLMSVGEISTIGEAREIISYSFENDYYEPSENAVLYKEAYEKFCNLQSKAYEE